jgi:hypothetical protein
VWSLFAGDVPGRLRGIARGATFLLAKTEDVRTETRVEEDNYVAALEWADSIGVDIISSSLAYLIFDNGFSSTPSQLNGDVAVTTVAVDSAARRGILVVTAAGNSGPGSRTIWTPADADSGLAIGAEDSLGNIGGFSSRGPTADGSIKPDFTAPGVAVCTVTTAVRSGGSTGHRLRLLSLPPAPRSSSSSNPRSHRSACARRFATSRTTARLPTRFAAGGVPTSPRRRSFPAA